MKKLLILIFVGVISMASNCGTGVGGGTTHPASQHLHAHVHLHWDWVGDQYYNIDQGVLIEQLAPKTFWANQFSFNDTPHGGYIGLQCLESETEPGLAIFSIWEANGCENNNAGSYCKNFSNEGSGKSCRIAYNLETDHIYRYRVWKLDADNLGQWWGGWILDITTGIETYIGKLRTSHGYTLKNSTISFVEYFGNAVDCDNVPESVAYFAKPTANHDDTQGTFQYGSTYETFNEGSCVNAVVNPTVFPNNVTLYKADFGGN